VVAIGILVNKELLLSPLQLLWLNLIMHVFPGIGLVMQRDTKSAMLVPPRDPKESLLTSQTLWSIIVRSAILATATALAPTFAHRELAGAQDSSIFLVVVSLSLILQSWSWLIDRSANSEPMFFTRKMLLNAPMLTVTAIGVLLVVVAVYFPPLQVILQTQPLDLTDWMVSSSVAVGTFLLSLVLCKFTIGLQPKGHDNLCVSESYSLH
jgi:Ca2+-transporting ATPase